MGELRDKEIISAEDGTRFGYAGDLLLDLESGRVRALIVPGRARLFGLLGRRADRLFRWEQIRHLGDDVILVEGVPAIQNESRWESAGREIRHRR